LAAGKEQMMTSKNLRTVALVSFLTFLAVSPSLAQRERDPGTGSQDSSQPSQGVSAFETRSGVVVMSSVDEKALYFTEDRTEEQLKVLLTEKTKIKIDKKKGGLELLELLTEGMPVKVTVSTETGEATSIKAKTPKQG
jgi:hypothetical protein